MIQVLWIPSSAPLHLQVQPCPICTHRWIHADFIQPHIAAPISKDNHLGIFGALWLPHIHGHGCVVYLRDLQQHPPRIPRCDAHGWGPTDAITQDFQAATLTVLASNLGGRSCAQRTAYATSGSTLNCAHCTHDHRLCPWLWAIQLKR